MDYAILNKRPALRTPRTLSLYRVAQAASGDGVLQGDHRPDDAEIRIIQLDARFDSAGAWAGVEKLVEMAYLDLVRLGERNIIAEHIYELHKVLLAHRQSLQPPFLCLTDTAAAAERTRFYPLDRAHRLVHGLVGLVLKWYRRSGDARRWLLIVRNFDQAEYLAARFFTELARRAETAQHLEVFIETGLPPGGAAPRLQGLQLSPAPPSLNDIDWDEPAIATPESVQTEFLETMDTPNAIALLEQNYPALLWRYQLRGNHLAAAGLAMKLFLVYNSHGYYHEARKLLELIFANFDQLVGDDETTRIAYVSKINICLVMTEDPEGALRVVGELAASYLTKPHLLANMNYILGMHYLRYAQAKDLRQAEEHILRAVQMIALAQDDPDTQRNPFQKVFIDNGLAFLRARQGRHQEALDLCESGYAFLTTELGEDRHRLHRSVLQYNIAQVYVMLGRIEEGIAHYRKAIAMDPYYSEYHNELGNLLQEQMLYPEAIRHYELAIAHSAPYDAVYFNKAVCHLRLGETVDALEAFCTTLELNPDQLQAYALQADIFRELGRTEEAIAGYDAALLRGYDTPAVRVNRAVLYFHKGLYRLALADMDAAIAQDAHEADHYENRAAIHQAMNEDALSLRDLELASRYRAVA